MGKPGKLTARRGKLVREMADLYGMLQGSIVKLYRRCGREGCRCRKGKKHGPAYYLSTKEKGRTQMLYIPKERLGKARTAVREYKKLKEHLEQIIEINREMFRQGKELR
jgi:hypothetical protein